MAKCSSTSHPKKHNTSCKSNTSTPCVSISALFLIWELNDCTEIFLSHTHTHTHPTAVQPRKSLIISSAIGMKQEPLYVEKNEVVVPRDIDNKQASDLNSVCVCV